MLLLITGPECVLALPTEIHRVYYKKTLLYTSLGSVKLSLTVHYFYSAISEDIYNLTKYSISNKIELNFVHPKHITVSTKILSTTTAFFY